MQVGDRVQEEGRGTGHTNEGEIVSLTRYNGVKFAKVQFRREERPRSVERKYLTVVLTRRELWRVRNRRG